MKNALLLLAITMLVAMPAMSQGWWSVGVGATLASPSGDFSNGFNMGFGGLVNGMYHFDQNFSAGLKSGYVHFSAKDVPDGGSGSVGIIPIVVTGKYYFMPTGDTRVFGALDLGLYESSASASGTVFGQSVSVSATSSDFGFSPAVGVTFKAGEKMNVDASVNYTSISTSGSSTSWIGLVVGLDFGM